MAIVDNLELWWDMSDLTTSTVEDKSGNGYTGTKSSAGNPAVGTGKVGNCQVFTSDWINTAFNPRTVIGTGDFSVAVWFKVTADANRDSFVYFGDSGDVNFYDAFVFQAGNNAGDGSNVNIAAREGTSGFQDYQATGYQDGNWHLAIYTRSGTTVHLYIDNVEIGTGETDAEYGVNLGALMRVGAGQANGNPATASLDELAIWTKVLSSDERTTLWNSGAGVTYDDIASVSVSVDAGVVTATLSTPAPSISGDANVAQGTPPTATFNTNAPAITGDANVAPNVLTATFTLPVPNIITPDAQVDVNAVTATFSLPAPAVSGDANVSVGVQTLTFSLPTSSVQIDAIIDAAVQVATFSTPPPTVTAIGNVSITASVVTATFNTNSPTVTAEQNAIAEPSVLTATFSIPAPTITAIRNVSVDVSVVTATFSVNTPTKVGGLWTAQPRVEGTWTPQARAV